jgi:hypothetical protein
VQKHAGKKNRHAPSKNTTYTAAPRSIGCAETESPYSDDNVEEEKKAVMCVNKDISLFGLQKRLEKD